MPLTGRKPFRHFGAPLACLLGLLAFASCGSVGSKAKDGGAGAGGATASGAGGASGGAGLDGGAGQGGSVGDGAAGVDTPLGPSVWDSVNATWDNALWN
jgi:hypothetical protein